jgi:hypothetical protein
MSLTHCFPLGTELACQRNTPYCHLFKWDKHSLVGKEAVMQNKRETYKCWPNSLEVRSLKDFNKVLLLELV